jgi:hypothetical protein
MADLDAASCWEIRWKQPGYDYANRVRRPDVRRLIPLIPILFYTHI